VHALVDSVTIEVKGAPVLDLWPVLKINGMQQDIEQTLRDAYEDRCRAVVESIREMEYRERQECDA
jgi:hypothetical protein